MSTWVDTKPQDTVDKWIKENGEAACERYDTDDPRFALWLACVDRAVQRRVVLSYMDMEDWHYYDAYDAGMSPVEAALEALEYNGYNVEGE